VPREGLLHFGSGGRKVKALACAVGGAPGKCILGCYSVLWGKYRLLARSKDCVRSFPSALLGSPL
jgi:hypothetical protein